MQILNNADVDLLVDVGANKGQYATEMRRAGYQGKIFSFEPVKSSNTIISAKAAKDEKWYVYRLGLGDKKGVATMNVSSNLASSSLLSMHKNHLEAAKGIEVVEQETIQLEILDSLLPTLKEYGHDEKIFLKIDTQGYEKVVLNGAKSLLATNVAVVQMEISLQPCYEGEWLFQEAIAYMNDKGFALKSIEPGLFNSLTGEMLQFDGIFVRNDHF